MPQSSTGTPALLPYDLEGQLMNGREPVPYINTLILAALQQLIGGSPAGGGIVVNQPPVTVHSGGVAANGSGSIPAGAKGWTFTVLTGTATFNGVTSLPAGFSDSRPDTLAAPIAYSCDAASTAYVAYGT